MLLGDLQVPTGVDQRVGLKRFQAWTLRLASHFMALGEGRWHGRNVHRRGESAAAAFEATGAFGDLIEFHLVPVLDIMESVPISARVLGWIDSIS